MLIQIFDFKELRLSKDETNMTV